MCIHDWETLNYTFNCQGSRRCNKVLYWKIGFWNSNRCNNGSYTFSNVVPKTGRDTEILLQVPDSRVLGEEKAEELMDQIGKSPTLIFKVDNCVKTVDQLRKKGVKILREPNELPYGTQAIIEDLYGN